MERFGWGHLAAVRTIEGSENCICSFECVGVDHTAIICGAEGILWNPVTGVVGIGTKRKPAIHSFIKDSSKEQRIVADGFLPQDVVEGIAKEVRSSVLRDAILAGLELC